MPLLAITVPGKINADDTKALIPAKTLSGLRQIARNWPGETVFVAETTGAAEPDAEDVDTFEFQIAPTTNRSRTLHQLRPDLVTTTLALSELPILEDKTLRTVVLAENSLQGRLEWVKRTSPTGRVSLRHELGLRRLEHRYRKALRRAAGIQLNGYPAWNAYEKLNPNALLFFDSRISAEDVDEARRERTIVAPAMTFAFSGRWLAPKGFLEAIASFQAANEMLDRSLQLKLFGDGELRGAVPEDPAIEAVGSLPFQTEWIPTVRATIDALLIPHTQPDPACTYLEGAGLGAPFLSFGNATAQALADFHNLGWTAPMGDIASLRDKIVAVANAPEKVGAAREAGLDFMSEHAFELEFAKRAGHLYDTYKASSRNR